MIFAVNIFKNDKNITFMQLNYITKFFSGELNTNLQLFIISLLSLFLSVVFIK
jgi:hypothetical protein